MATKTTETLAAIRAASGGRMSRALLVAELATAHGGDVALAGEMIRAAADAGADLVKLQSYSLAKLNPRDPQAAWLRQAHLDRAAHEELLRVAQGVGVELFSTPFDADSLTMLRELGLTRFKIASSESSNGWWAPNKGEQWIVSYPWGGDGRCPHSGIIRLTAIPLYPAPLEAVGRAMLLDGWSDHCVGLSACLWALAQGAQMIEVHFTWGAARRMPWDKTQDDLRVLRRFADDCATMRMGVAQQFRERWQRA